MLLLLPLTFCFLFFSGCTDSRPKELAQESAQTKLRAEFRAEAYESLGPREKFLNMYVSANLNLTEIIVVKDTRDGSEATVELRMKRPSVRARQALREVMAKLDSWKDASFNPTDALQLIGQNLKIEKTDTDDEITIFKLKKSQSQDWKLVD
jgi:hypothetical protein